MQTFLLVQIVEQKSSGIAKIRIKVSFCIMVSFCIFILSIIDRRCQQARGRKQNALLCQ